jgi:hypothetical protein
MPIEVKLQKSVVLRFTLPGNRRSSSSRSGNGSSRYDEGWQLGQDRTREETWVLEIDADNAAETRSVLLELARQIDLTCLISDQRGP